MNLMHAFKLKDSVRKPLAFSLCLLVLILALFGIWYASWFDCTIPFSPCYHSWLEDIMELSLFPFGVIIVYMVTIDQYKNQTRTIFMGIALILTTIIGLLAAIVYHSFYHQYPMVFGFRGMDKVTPYHIEFSIIFFMNFIVFNFFCLFLRPMKLWLRFANLLIAIAGLLLLEVWKNSYL